MGVNLTSHVLGEKGKGKEELLAWEERENNVFSTWRLTTLKRRGGGNSLLPPLKKTEFFLLHREKKKRGKESAARPLTRGKGGKQGGGKGVVSPSRGKKGGGKDRYGGFPPGGRSREKKRRLDLLPKRSGLVRQGTACHDKKKKKDWPARTGEREKSRRWGRRGISRKERGKKAVVQGER